MLLLISAGGVRCHNICVHTRVWEIGRSPREEIQLTFVSFNFVLLPSDTVFNSQSPASKYVATNVKLAGDAGSFCTLLRRAVCSPVFPKV